MTPITMPMNTPMKTHSRFRGANATSKPETMGSKKSMAYLPADHVWDRRLEQLDQEQMQGDRTADRDQHRCPPRLPAENLEPEHQQRHGGQFEPDSGPAAEPA